MSNVPANFFTKKKHIFYFFLLFTIALLTSAYFYYHYAAMQIKDNKALELETIAKLKLNGLEQWHKERISDIKVISESRIFVLAIKNWLAQNNDSQLSAEIQERIRLVRESYNYDAIFITSHPGNQIWYSEGLEGDRLDSITILKISQTSANDSIVESDLYYCNLHEKIHLDLIAPLKSSNGETIAKIVFRIDPKEYLFPLIQSWPVQTESAESILLKLDGDHIVYLNELRSQKNTALKLRFPLTRKELPAVQAAIGYTGIFEGTDYSNTKVLAYLCKVPSTNWFMVNKIDQSEIYSSIRYMGTFVLIIAALVLTSMFVVLVLLYNNRQKNIYKKLWETQEELKTTLYSIGDAVIVTDTQGRIKNLNVTAENLTGWKEEEALNKPLKDVFRIINEESRKKVENPVQKVMQDGTVVGLANHTLLIAKDGTEIPIADSGAPVRDEAGAIIGVVLVFRDQTKERLAQKELEKNEAFIRTVMDNLPIGIAVNTVYPEVKFSYMNNNFSKFYRTSAEDLTDPNSFWDSVYEDEEYRKKIKTKVLEDIASGDPQRMHWEDIPITRKGEPTTYISARNIPLTENNLMVSVVWDVTDRILAEEEVLHQNRLYKMLSESNQAIVRLANREDLFNKITRVAVQHGGFKLASICLMNFEENKLEIHSSFGEEAGFLRNTLLALPAEADKNPYLRSFKQNKIVIINDIAGDNEFVNFRDEAIRKNYFSAAVTPIQLDNKTIGIFVLFSSENNFFRNKEISLIREVGIDISFALDTYEKERKRLEIERERALLNHTIEHSRNEIYLFDAETFKFRFVNSGATHNLGYSLAELTEMTPLDIKPLITPQEFINITEPLIRKEKVIQIFETVHKRKNGSTYPCEVRLQLFEYENEKIFLAVIQDITDRKLAEEALKESEGKYRLVLDNSLDAILLTVPDGRILSANKAAEKMFMRSEEEICRLGRGGVIDISDPRLNVALEERERTGIFNGELTGVRADGTKFPIEISSSIFLDKQGNRKSSMIIRDISEKKKAEEKIQSIFKTAPTGIGVVTNRIFLEVNAKFCELVGYSKEELIGQSAEMIYASAEEFHFVGKEKYNQISEKGIGTVETKFKQKNGNIINVLLNSTPINPADLSQGVVFSALDITERRKYQDALEESEEKFRTIIDTSIEGICSSDIDENINFVNPRFAEMTGFSMEELLRMNFRDLISHEELNDHLEQKSKRKSGGSSIYERKFKRKDGSIIWLKVSATPIFSKDGLYKGSFGMFTDITQQKLSELEIRKLYRGVEQSPASVIITDYDGNIEYVNQKFCSVTGYNYEEVIGKNPRIISSGEKSKEEWAELWNKIKSGKEWVGEFHNKRKSGELFWESALISPILDEKGVITHFIGIKEDITEKKKILEDLIEAKEKAEEMNRVKSYFFANMSHELRTPFVGIQGYAELLAETVTDPEAVQMVEAIIESSKRLTDTLDKILSLSKIEFEAVQVSKSSVNVNDVLIDCYNLFIGTTSKKGIDFKLKLLDPPLEISTDEKILRGIINNLINNAIKFTITGKVEIEANVKLTKRIKNLVIKISDSGIGIPQEKQKLIWEAFRQASEGLNRSFEGTGLGLTITKRYVEMLGGTISLMSDLGKGSIFTVEIPIEAVKIENHKYVEPIKKIDDSKQIFSSAVKRILYVEDDDLARDVLVKKLSKNYIVDSVEDAEKALEIVNTIQYDALLVDINLGRGMDGAQFVEKIREIENYKNVPAVAITAYAADTDRHEFLSRGFSHYISKPFSLAELSNLLNKVFAEKG